MSDDKELHQFFKSGKDEIPDEDFSRNVMNKLPRRSRILPFLIVIICTVLGLVLTVSIIGTDLFVEQIFSFALSLSRLEIPSASSITAYIVGLLLLGTVSFAIYETEREFLE